METNRTFSIKVEEFQVIAYALECAIMDLENLQRDVRNVAGFDLEEKLQRLRDAKKALAGR